MSIHVEIGGRVITRCTAAFLWTSPAAPGRDRGAAKRPSVRYGSTAGHCTFVDDTKTEETHAPGKGPLIRLSQVRGGVLEAGPPIGHVVYTGQDVPVLYPDEKMPDFMDLALFELLPNVVADPSMCGFGGPTGLATAPVAVGQPVRLYGQSDQVGLDPATGAPRVPARSGVGTASAIPGAVVDTIPTSGGDSGSPLLDGAGRALAVESGPYASLVSSSAARAAEVLGRRLVLSTAPLTPGAAPFGADPRCTPPTAG